MDHPDTPQPRVARRREKNALLAAALTNGPTELIDFILPLWAGIALGATATEVGILVAVEMLVSVLVRPVAGVLADRRERRSVAGVGALLYALSSVGYALAPSLPTALLAAAVGGVGGALLWVCLRTIVGERLAADSTVFPRLLAAQENGTWVAFVAGMVLLNVIGFFGIFLACAAACLLGALALFLSPARRPAERSTAGAEAAGVGLRGVARGLRPMLLAVVVTMTAEAAIGMLLLLHLQRGFELEIVEIAYVFLPGAIAMGVLPGRLHRLVRRFGRSRVLATASAASAVFALSLAWAPNPLVIAALWVLSGVAWAAVMPIQQAVIVEASPGHTGRAMGLYESASLVGGLLGSVAAGVLYDTGSWTTACLVSAVVILSGVFLVPRAVRGLGVAEFPVETAPEPQTPGESTDDDGTSSEAAAVSSARTATELEQRSSDAAAGQQKPPKTAREQLTTLGGHLALFLLAQVALTVADLSWAFELVTGRLDAEAILNGGGSGHEGLLAFVYGAGRIWTITIVVDVIWTLVSVLRTRRSSRRST